jgi:hypothetical protein
MECESDNSASEMEQDDNLCFISGVRCSVLPVDSEVDCQWFGTAPSKLLNDGAEILLGPMLGDVEDVLFITGADGASAIMGV